VRDFGRSSQLTNPNHRPLLQRRSKEQEYKLERIDEQMEIFRKLQSLPKPTDDQDPDEDKTSSILVPILKNTISPST
jgi:hypothetical protein